MSTMDRRHAELAFDAAVFGLGNAELAELAACEAIDTGLALELELVAADLAAGLTEVGPLPERLRASLLSRAGEVVAPPTRAPVPAAIIENAPPVPDHELTPTAALLPIAPPRPRRLRVSGTWLPWAMALAASLLAVIVTLRGRTDRSTEGQERTAVPPSPSRARQDLIAMAGTVVLPFAATDDAAARGAQGDVVWHSGVQRGFIRISGLRRNDKTREQYQLWVFDDTRDDRYPVDGGVFDIDADGDVIIPIEVPIPVRTATLFAVTVEKPGGVVVSSRERIVLAAK